MPAHSKQPIDTATLCGISSIIPEHVSQKLRVAGRLLVYDRDTAVMLLADGASAVLVDLTLCLDPFKPTPWLKESNTILIVIGSLDEVEQPYPPVVLPLHARPVEVDLQLVLRALSVREAPHLDLQLWNKAITLRERASAEKKNG